MNACLALPGVVCPRSCGSNRHLTGTPGSAKFRGMNTTNRRPFEIVPGQRVRITACTHIDLDRGTAKLLCNGLLFDVVRQGQASWYVTATYQYVG